MKNKGFGRKFLSILLAVLMVFSGMSLPVKAAVGDLSNVDTGLSGDIDTDDTVSLPIQILDYEADGMLFEYAESIEVKDVSDFGATWAADFASITDSSKITNSMFGNFWSDVTTSLNTTNSRASYLRVEYSETTANNKGAFYGRASVITPNDLGGIPIDNTRYLVMVYRSNITDGKIGFWVERENLTDRTDSNNRTGNLTFTSEGTTNWTYAVYDLKQGNLANTWTSYGDVTSIFTTLPLDSSGEYMDIAHIALFADADQAAAFGEYALTDGSDRGDNRAFGLLRSSRTESDGTNYAGVLDKTTTVEQFNTYGDTETLDFSKLTTLGYTLLGTFKVNGIANIGLLESSLSDKGLPVYKEEVVSYLAGLLEHSLEIPERTSDGWKNYRYVKGEASSLYGGTDLATALRTKINGNTGSYADTVKTVNSGKKLVGTWDECQGNIDSYFDAAYFLLNSIFVDGSYNDPQDKTDDPNTSDTNYDYLVLSAGTDKTTEDKVYVFDGGFATSSDPTTAQMAIDYNATNQYIQNTSAAGKAHFVYEGSNTTTLNPFLPVTDRNNANGQTKSTYYQDDAIINTVMGVATKDTYLNRNFNFAMYSSGEFVYHADDELFFDFEGDDDVYLFINNELVMDIGSAHSIDGVRFELNDYVNAAKAGTLGSDARNKALSLQEGDTYSFKFYYMERHGYGSNMRISTNIKITDPTMKTEKTAWQDGTKLDFGSIVDKDKVVEYGFSITNSGSENLYNLTFSDLDIGVSLDPTNGLKVTGSRVYDVNGGTLDVTDLTAIVSGPGYDDITVTFKDNDALKAFLASMTSDAVIENGGGLWKGSSVTIRGIGYTLSEQQIEAGVFDNTVLTSSTNKTKSKTLQGQANMRVFVPSDPMYYEWAGHDLEVTKTKLITDVLEAANQTDNILNGKVSNLTASNVNEIELVTKAGTAISSSYVTIDSEYNITINYPTTGSKVFYVKVTYDSSKYSVIVPVLVNVTDVKDSVYVLDYGLKVDLTANNELIKNDTLTVPGRTTSNSILAIGTNGTYSPNEVTFTSSNSLEKDNGTYTYADGSITYEPTKFMESIDTVQVALNVYESDITPSKITGTLDINNEVEMYKNISVLPANVVYYEDDFPAITYKYVEDKNIFTKVGEGSSSLEQSNNQNINYGSDDTYASGNNDEYSGASLTTIKIANNDVQASFSFSGTGFELIGRTNAKDSATLVVKVKDSNDKTVKNLPVITEFDNNNDGGDEAIYQVPVIKVKGLTLGTYTVEISGIPARDYNNLDAEGNPTISPTYLYVDGLRIFEPMGATNDNYLETENGTTFNELRNLVLEGKVALATYTDSLTYSTATVSWTEDYDGSTKDEVTGKYVNKITKIEDYLKLGPNNEVYMDGTTENAALVFYVKEKKAEDDTNSEVYNLQIAIRGVDAGLFHGSTSTEIKAPFYYGIEKTVNEETVYEWAPITVVTSGTEQYYTIDYTKCPYDSAKDAYMVMVKVDVEEETNPLVPAMAAFMSVKLKGLDLMSFATDTIETTDLYYVNGVLSSYVDGMVQSVEESEYPTFYSVRRMMMAPRAIVETPDDSTEKEDNSSNDSTNNSTNTESNGAVNTTTDNKENANDVETGDNSNAGTYGFVALVALAVLALFGKKKFFEKEAE